MATFTAFSDILPDPVHKLTAAGSIDNATGTAGAGFAEVNFTSEDNSSITRTRSGRGVGTSNGAHQWKFSINYNPMLKYQFDPIDAFLGFRKGKLKPFYVVLPQHSRPKNTTFATFANSNVIRTQYTGNSGQSSLSIYSAGTMLGDPTYGDFFTISDPANVNHKKAYKIVAVETNTLYMQGTVQPSTAERRIHFEPPLERSVNVNSIINFIEPKFRVTQVGNTREHNLNKDGLYGFSINLEEIQP